MTDSASPDALGIGAGPTRAKVLRVVDALVLLAAAGVLAATAAALGAKLWWGFELFTHFRLHYAALQMLLGAALLALGRRRTLAVVALAAVPNIVPLIPYVPIGTIEARAVATRGSTTLMAVNVEWRNRSSERLLELIELESPDVVLIVELTPRWQQRLEPIFADYPHRVLSPARGAFGIGLLSRLPLKDAHTFALESTPAIDATIAGPDGDLRLIGVHLKPPTRPAQAAERARQLDALRALRRSIEEPLAIAGDFNITPYSPYFSEWLRDTELRDARAGRGPGVTWPAFLPLLGIPIDHCVVSTDVGVAAFRRLPAFGSDHYPIVVELFMEGEQ